MPSPLLCTLLLSLAVGSPVDLGPLRQEVQREQAELSRLTAERDARTAELQQLSEEVSSLKAKQRRLGPTAELRAALAKSQELADTLEALEQHRAVTRKQLTASAAQLDEALGGVLAGLRSEWDEHESTSERRALVTRIRALHQERQSLHALVPAPPEPHLPAVTPTEDPDELLLQADAARDAEDKANEQLKQVRARLSEAEQEAALERRMDAFVASEAIMDEQAHDLRVKVSASTSTPSFNGPASTNSTPIAGSTSSSNGPTASPTSVIPVGSASPVAPLGGGSSSFAASEPSQTASSKPQPATLEDARPQGSAPTSVGGAVPEDIPSLRARERELKHLAEQLAHQAEAAEAKAKALR